MDHPGNGGPYDFVTESGRMTTGLLCYTKVKTFVMENGRTDSAAISIKMFVQKVGWGDSGVAGCKALRAGSIFFQNETVDSELTRGHASFVTDKPLLEAGSLTRRQAQQKPS